MMRVLFEPSGAKADKFITGPGGTAIDNEYNSYYG